MKSTGIIRRIDDLGRVVIPKEIRRNFKIREGDPLEIFTTEEGIVFRKYNLYEGLNPDKIASAMNRAHLSGFVVNDDGDVIGGRKPRDMVLPDDMREFRGPKALDNTGVYFVYPLVLDGDWYCAMVVKKSTPNALEIASGIAAMAFGDME